jgi:Fe-S oxidoreductase
MQVKLYSGFGKNKAAREAADLVQKCVHCGFCNATCPTYQDRFDERDGPRGRIYLIRHMLESGQAGDATRIHLRGCRARTRGTSLQSTRRSKISPQNYPMGISLSATPQRGSWVGPHIQADSASGAARTDSVETDHVAWVAIVAAGHSQDDRSGRLCSGGGHTGNK